MSSDSAPPPAILEYLPYLPEEPAIWLVGGIPRDQLLGRVSRDFDFVVAGEARALARRFADQLGAAYYALDRERDIGRVILTGGEKDRITFDFARLRGTTIEDDLRDRDFTINAIAVRLSAPYTWIDPLGGARDVKEKVVKACSSHSLADDPVRALRAIRFALSFGFQIADETREGIVRVKGTLGSVSFERIRDELMQICRMPHPGKAFRLLDYMGILDSLFPELGAIREIDFPAAEDINALEHTLAVVDRLGDLLTVLDPVHDPQAAGNLLWAEVALRLGRFRNPLADHLARYLSQANQARQILFFAAICHTAGLSGGVNSETPYLVGNTEAVNSARIAGAIGRRMRLSNAGVDLVERIVRHQGTFEGLGFEQLPSPRAIYRFFRTTHGAGVEVIMLALASFIGARAARLSQDRWAQRVELARALLEAFFENRRRVVDPPQLIDGDDIMRVLHLEPGPVVGELLEVVREAQAAAEVATRSEALTVARETYDAWERSA
jgi:poly(A) polymerase